MTLKIFITLTTLVFMVSCGGAKKTKSKSSSDKKGITATKTPEKKAKKLHKDPCSEPGRCVGVTEISYATAEQKLQAAKQIQTEQAQNNNLLQRGERLIYSHLTLITDEDKSQGPSTSARCYTLHTEEKEFIESKDNVAINMDKELKEEDYSSFDIFVSDYKDHKLLNETQTCRKAFANYKKETMISNGWEAYDTKNIPIDFQSNQELSEEESTDETKVEISEKLFKLSVDGKPAYRFEIIRKEIDRNSNKVVQTNNMIHMISIDLAISSPVIYAKDESFNSKNELIGYTSELLMARKDGEPSNREYPKGFIVEGSN